MIKLLQCEIFRLDLIIKLSIYETFSGEHRKKNWNDKISKSPENLKRKVLNKMTQTQTHQRMNDNCLTPDLEQAFSSAEVVD